METHILFFILAGVLIAILIGAGIWSARREKSQVFSNTFSTRPPATPISNGLNSDVPASLATSGFNSPSETGNFQQANENLAQAQQHEIEQSVSSIRISLPGQTQAVNIQPEIANPQFSYAEQAMPVSQQEDATLRMQEPQAHLSQAPAEQVELNEQTSAQQADTLSTQPRIITLYVVAAEGQPFYGENVVQNLEAFGFQYGEYQIFHRHLDNASSPVLFSVANMIQPGIFDLNNLDFTTVGLTFFMQLPSAGNDSANLRLLIGTVESFAQAMGGFVLNEQQQLFDEASRQAYMAQVSQSSQS